MKAHLVQFNIAWENPSANFKKVDQLLSSANLSPNDLILLPEMFDSGFSFAVSRTVDTGATLSYLTNLAHRTRCTVHGHHTVLESDSKPRNRATILAPDGTILTHYDKIHLFSYGRETEHISPGASLTSYTWNAATVCPAICYDLRFPELFRAAVPAANIFALGACWPAARQHHRRTLCLARAIENQAFVLMCNRCGKDPAPSSTAYDGHSMIIDPKGEILAEADDSECVLSSEINVADAHAWRTKFPALHDMKFTINPPR